MAYILHCTLIIGSNWLHAYVMFMGGGNILACEISFQKSWTLVLNIFPFILYLHGVIESFILLGFLFFFCSDFYLFIATHMLCICLHKLHMLENVHIVDKPTLKVPNCLWTLFYYFWVHLWTLLPMSKLLEMQVELLNPRLCLQVIT